MNGNTENKELEGFKTNTPLLSTEFTQCRTPFCPQISLPKLIFPNTNLKRGRNLSPSTQAQLEIHFQRTNKEADKELFQDCK